jgi:alpha-galactosidase
MSTQVDFSKLGFSGPVKAKDLWLSKDLGTISTPYTVTVPGHGVLFLRVSQ